MALRKKKENSAEPEFESSEEEVKVNDPSDNPPSDVYAVPTEVADAEKAHLQWIYERLGALGDSPEAEWMVKLKEIIDGK